MITLIRAKYLLAYDEKTDNHKVILNGEIAYKDDTIIYIGKKYNGHYDKEIDAKDNLAAPGFIDLDALGDIDHTLIFFEHPAENRRELDWSNEYFENERKEEMSIEDEKFKSLYAYVQLIRNGITTAMPITSVIYKKSAETYEEIAAAAKHAGELGLRVYLGPSYLAKKHVLSADQKSIELRSLPKEELEEGLFNAEKFIREYHNTYNGLIQAAVVPERIELQTEESLKKSKAIAKKYDVYFRLHAAQGPVDYNYTMKKFGLSPIKYLDSIGLLDEKTLIPHCTHTSGSRYVADKSNDDLKILSENKTSVIHCPLVYQRSGNALDSFGRFVREGVHMTMGTDTYPCDPFIVMRTGQTAAKIFEGNCTENSLDNFYKAFTIGGADALGRKDLGRLKVGAKADIILIDMSDFSVGVLDDPIKTIALSGNGNMVKTSIINGKTVMEDRRISGIDLDELSKRAQIYYEKMKYSYWKRSVAKNKKTQAELFHSIFPIEK
ncbi:MAG: chlorohydrolase family protein [Tissierellia bacterium]|nr:chlorohydrolase family protein [Tissierellia bacterium]